MKLYYAPAACSLAPHIVLRETGVAFTLEKVDTARHRLADGTDLHTVNAKGQVPVLELDDGTRLTEGPVIAQFIADPHVQARQIVTELPDDEMGAVPMHAIVPRLSGTPGEIRHPAPALGQHNDEVIRALGYSAETIADLRKRKVI